MNDEEHHPQSDERGSEAPASEGHDKAPQEGSGAERESDAVDSPGPQGNPESDEEALSHRQQEGESPADG